MRIAVLLAASALLGGCSQLGPASTGPAALTPITPSRAAQQTTAAKPAKPATPTPPTPPTWAAAPGSAPAPGAPAAEAIAWVQAAPPVDGKDFQVALRNGEATSLGQDFAFTTPAGTQCMTDFRRGSRALACLVDLVAPPAQPPDVYGVWKGGWVDFDGATVEVGSSHGDPGRFGAGQGRPLPEGGSLSFGDFRCRTDATTLVCVNYARQSAVRYSPAGVEPLGCARQSPPPGIGVQFSC